MVSQHKLHLFICLRRHLSNSIVVIHYCRSVIVVVFNCWLVYCRQCYVVPYTIYCRTRSDVNWRDATLTTRWKMFIFNRVGYNMLSYFAIRYFMFVLQWCCVLNLLMKHNRSSSTPKIHLITYKIKLSAQWYDKWKFLWIYYEHHFTVSISILE